MDLISFKKNGAFSKLGLVVRYFLKSIMQNSGHVRTLALVPLRAP